MTFKPVTIEYQIRCDETPTLIVSLDYDGKVRIEQDVGRDVILASPAAAALLAKALAELTVGAPPAVAPSAPAPRLNFHTAILMALADGEKSLDELARALDRNRSAVLAAIDNFGRHLRVRRGIDTNPGSDKYRLARRPRQSSKAPD